MTSQVARILKTPSLEYRDFRFLSISSGFNSFGMAGEMVLIGWVVLELTNSPFSVGLTMGLRMVPMLMLGIPAGVIADRVKRHIFLRLLNLSAVVPLVIPGLFAMANALTFWHVVVFTVVSGTIQTFQQVTRQSFAYDIVGAPLAVNGLSVVNFAMRIGGLVGSFAVGSATERLGVDYAYFVLATCNLFSFLVLLYTRSQGQAAPTVTGTLKTNFQDYFHELRVNRTLLMLVILTGSVEIFGFSHMVLMPSIARDVLNVGAEGLGIISGIRSIGGIVGIIAIFVFGEIRRKGLVFLGVLYGFGICILCLGMFKSFVLVLIFLTLANAAAALSDVLSQSIMQLNVSNALRGRAMGSWILAVGTGPIGHTQIGALASLGGLAFALSINGIGLLILATVVTIIAPGLRKL